MSVKELDGNLSLVAALKMYESRKLRAKHDRRYLCNYNRDCVPAPSLA